MVDSFNTPDPALEAPAPEPKKGLAGFFASTAGKLVIGGVALILIGGAIAAILFFFVFGQDTSSSDNGVVVPPVTTSTAGQSQETSPTERPAEPWADTFAFRNIFQPTVKVSMSVDTSSTGSNGSSSTVDVPADTLFLVSVSTQDGEDVAELVWNGTTYVLAEGDTIPDTPWKVLSISGDTVVMLFGDSRVTLTVGQGIAK